MAKLAKLFVSPGPIYEPEGTGDDWWRTARALHAAGVRAGDLVINTLAYHFVPAGSMFESGARAIGCSVVPAGTGQTEMQVSTIRDLRISSYVGTPSFLKLIVEKADEMKVDIGCLKKALVGAEYLPPALRAAMRARGIQVLQMYGTADLGLIAYETQAPDGSVNDGMILEEALILEIVRPGTGDPVAPGEVGEVVITTFNPDYPLIRFATGDLSAVLDAPSPCGRTNVRIKGWMGRADQTTKVRAMFVTPKQVNEIVRRHAGGQARAPGHRGRDRRRTHDAEMRGRGRARRPRGGGGGVDPRPHQAARRRGTGRARQPAERRQGDRRPPAQVQAEPADGLFPPGRDHGVTEMDVFHLAQRSSGRRRRSCSRCRSSCPAVASGERNAMDRSPSGRSASGRRDRA